MKRSIKAALLSGLVFPGLGHFSLGRPVRGCLFLIPAAAGAVYLVRQATEVAGQLSERIMDGSLPLDPQAIAARIDASGGGQWDTLASIACIVCWVGSILDSFLIGARGPR